MENENSGCVNTTIETKGTQQNLEDEKIEIAGGRNGLFNLGNTCYMNTGLQVCVFCNYLLFCSAYHIFLNLPGCFSQTNIILW